MKKLINTGLLIVFLLAGKTLAQTEIVPILEMKVRGLLGGVQNGKFIDAKTTFARSKGKKTFALYGTLGREEGRVTAEIEAPDVPCDDFYSINSEPGAPAGVAIGEKATWNPVPRPAQVIALDNAAYVKAASDALKTKGIVNKAPKIRQSFRVDLDGDGKDEVLLTATSYEGNIQPSAKRGDYSFVLLRKIIGGKVQNIILTGDFVTKSIKFGAPGKYEISSIADLNGDGKMELIIYGAYYEGNWIEVFELKADKPTSVKALNVACGV